MQKTADIAGYGYRDSGASHAHAYLLPAVDQALKEFALRTGSRLAAFDLGCGNGFVAAHLSRAGYQVAGVDPSSDGIREARAAHPDLRLETGSAYDDLVVQYGTYPVVVSLEVVEHVYAPRHYAKTLFDLVEPGGIAIVSTPYHGYVKNVALAVTGRFDRHFDPLWDHGHIKFWSPATLSALLREAGFSHIRLVMVGRFWGFAKSMIAVAEKDEDGSS